MLLNTCLDWQVLANSPSTDITCAFACRICDCFFFDSSSTVYNQTRTTLPCLVLVDAMQVTNLSDKCSSFEPNFTQGSSHWVSTPT